MSRYELYLHSIPPRTSTAATNFSWSSTVHVSRFRFFGSSYPLLSGSDKSFLSRISSSLGFSVDDEIILFLVLLRVGPWGAAFSELCSSAWCHRMLKLLLSSGFSTWMRAPRFIHLGSASWLSQEHIAVNKGGVTLEWWVWDRWEFLKIIELWI